MRSTSTNSAGLSPASAPDRAGAAGGASARASTPASAEQLSTVSSPVVPASRGVAPPVPERRTKSAPRPSPEASVGIVTSPMNLKLNHEDGSSSTAMEPTTPSSASSAAGPVPAPRKRVGAAFQHRRNASLTHSPIASSTQRKGKKITDADVLPAQDKTLFIPLAAASSIKVTVDPSLPMSPMRSFSPATSPADPSPMASYAATTSHHPHPDAALAPKLEALQKENEELRLENERLRSRLAAAQQSAAPPPHERRRLSGPRPARASWAKASSSSSLMGGGSRRGSYGTGSNRDLNEPMLDPDDELLLAMQESEADSRRVAMMKACSRQLWAVSRLLQDTRLHLTHGTELDPNSVQALGTPSPALSPAVSMQAETTQVDAAAAPVADAVDSGDDDEETA